VREDGEDERVLLAQPDPEPIDGRHEVAEDRGGAQGTDGADDGCRRQHPSRTGPGGSRSSPAASWRGPPELGRASVDSAEIARSDRRETSVWLLSRYPGSTLAIGREGARMGARALLSRRLVATGGYALPTTDPGLSGDGPARPLTGPIQTGPVTAT